MSYSDQLIDKRVVERNIAKGLVDPAELKQQIEALPDTEQNAVLVSLDAVDDGPEDDIDDEDDLDEDDEGEGEAEGED